jgi:ribosome-associated protein
MEISKIKNILKKTLDENKAKNIVTIDLRKKSFIADYMIIASGTSSRHLQSLSENLIFTLKQNGFDNCRMEGRESSDWKLVDAIDIIVHIFHPDKREFYDLEKMWAEPIPKQKAIL